MSILLADPGQRIFLKQNFSLRQRGGKSSVCSSCSKRHKSAASACRRTHCNISLSSSTFAPFSQHSFSDPEDSPHHIWPLALWRIIKSKSVKYPACCHFGEHTCKEQFKSQYSAVSPHSNCLTAQCQWSALSCFVQQMEVELQPLVWHN